MRLPWCRGYDYAMGPDYVPVAFAARWIGKAESTIRNMLDDGRLAGTTGDQPVRPRRYVKVDGKGRLMAPDGQPVESSGSPDALRNLSQRVECPWNERCR